MTDTRRDRTHAADQVRADVRWGMSYADDPRAASPERLAYEARARGDVWFQIDVALNAVQGTANISSGYTRTIRGDEPARDFIGAVEAQGWALQHVAVTFVEHGTSSMKAVGGAAEHANHGTLVGLYVFRRRDNP